MTNLKKNKKQSGHHKSEKFSLKKKKTKKQKQNLKKYTFFHSLFYLYNNTIIKNIYYKIN